MSKNLIFTQKITKLWACQISQNKKNTLHNIFISLPANVLEEASSFPRIPPTPCNT